METTSTIIVCISRIVILAIFSWFVFAGFAKADDYDTCSNKDGINGPQVLAACERAIASRKYRGNALSDLYDSRGIELSNNGLSDRALADYNESIRLNPAHTSTYINRGNEWIIRGQYDRAIDDASKEISILRNADDSEAISQAYGMRGEAWRLKGDLDKSLADLNKAISLDKTVNSNFVRRADLWRFRGDLARALADANTALKAEYDYADAYRSRGMTYERMGDFENARADFEKCLTFPANNDDEDARLEAQKTASARLAALKSTRQQPAISPVPIVAKLSTSIPTPAVAIPNAPTAANLIGRRVALIIGNSTYQNVPALLNPEKDAAAVAATLRNIGFEIVTLANDQTHEQMINALRNFANEAEKSDWAMVYYAGHGMEVGGVNYLIPIDAKIAVDRDIQFEAVPLTQVLNAADTAKKIRLVMLDACRDNPFKPRQTAAPEVVAASMSTAGAPITTRSTNGRGLAEVKVTGATLVVYAAKDGQVALDGEGGNSPFAVAVVQRLATPGVEINKLFRLVRDDVMEATAGRQEPYTYGSLPGKEDFFFVAK